MLAEAADAVALGEPEAALVTSGSVLALVTWEVPAARLTRAPTGGGYPPPRRFFVDSGKTAARSAAKFGMPIPSSFLHIMCKL